jgi:hypothetical protein
MVDRIQILERVLIGMYFLSSKVSAYLLTIR